MGLVPNAQEIGKSIADHLSPIVKSEVADAESRIRSIVEDVLSQYQVTTVTTFQKKETK